MKGRCEEGERQRIRVLADMNFNVFHLFAMYIVVYLIDAFANGSIFKRVTF